MSSINCMLWNSAFLSHYTSHWPSSQHSTRVITTTFLMVFLFIWFPGLYILLTYLLPHFFLSHLFWLFFIPVYKIERPHSFNPLLYYKYKSNCMVWCFRIVVLERNLESPLDYKEIKPVNPKGNQSLIFTGRADAEAEAPVVWPPDAKNQLIGKDPDAREAWG